MINKLLKHWPVWGGSLLGIVILGIVVFVFQANAKDKEQAIEAQNIIQQQLDSQKEQLELQAEQLEEAEDQEPEATPPEPASEPT